MSVCAALFDLDDTLFDHRHCAREALAAVRTSHAAFTRIDASALERLHATILEALHLEVLAGRIDLDAARIERFARLCREVGHEPDDDLAAGMAAMYRQGYIDARRQVAGAAALLEAVRRHARIVVVSNNLLNEQRAKIRHCGLEPLVDVLVVSEEVGISKPHPAIFTEALARAGCTAEAAVMVGDSWANDVEGARAAGIRPVWFNPDRRLPPDPTVQMITALEPVADVVAAILGRDFSSPAAPAPTGPASTGRP
jgi:HAD superfamily hydrolase (TIGR01549 family)